MAIEPVAMGAPPVEVEDEGADDLDVDEAVSEADEPDEVLVVWALGPEVRAVGPGVAVTA